MGWENWEWGFRCFGSEVEANGIQAIWAVCSSTTLGGSRRLRVLWLALFSSRRALLLVKANPPNLKCLSK